MVGAMIRGSFDPAEFDQEEEAATKVAGETDHETVLDVDSLLMEARPFEPVTRPQARFKRSENRGCAVPWRQPGSRSDPIRKERSDLSASGVWGIFPQELTTGRNPADPTKEGLLGSDPAGGASRPPSRKERSDCREVVGEPGLEPGRLFRAKGF